MATSSGGGSGRVGVWGLIAIGGRGETSEYRKCEWRRYTAVLAMTNLIPVVYGLASGRNPTSAPVRIPNQADTKSHHYPLLHIPKCRTRHHLSTCP